jgi:hypothetical protein
MSAHNDRLYPHDIRDLVGELLIEFKSLLALRAIGRRSYHDQRGQVMRGFAHLSKCVAIPFCVDKRSSYHREVKPEHDQSYLKHF